MSFASRLRVARSFPWVVLGLVAPGLARAQPAPQPAASPPAVVPSDTGTEPGDPPLVPRPPADPPPVSAPPAKPAAEPPEVPVFIPPAPPEIPRPAAKLSMPLRTTKRSMVLPHGAFSPSVTILYDHPSTYTLQVPNLAVSAAIGAGRNIDVDLSVTAPLERAVQSIFAFTYKVVGTDAVQIGLRPELGILGLRDDDDRYSMVMRPGISVPILFDIGNMFRVELGFSLQSYLPTDGRTRAYAGFVERSIDPAVEGPGLPFGFTFQPFEFLYLGVDSGVGLLEVRSKQQAEEIVDGFFFPLGWRLGGTIPLDRRPLFDIIGNVGFPYLAIGAEDPATTELWQLGLTVKAFAAL